MPKTREEVQKAFGLTEPPSDEFMALLERLGEGEVVRGVSPVEGDGYTADELAEELEEAVVAESVGDLLSRARQETGRSLRDVGAAAGVSHSRVRELEQSSNVELATLARLAEALGYRATIVLEPARKLSQMRKLSAEL